jgi:hypothetical protein
MRPGPMSFDGAARDTVRVCGGVSALSYSQRFDSGWQFSMDLVADHLVARLVRGSEVHELFTRDRIMLDLPGKGYEPTVTARPWVVWKPGDDGEWYVWMCANGATIWTKAIQI